MSPIDARPGRRLTISRGMFAIGIIALALAPMAEAVHSPTPARVAMAVTAELFVGPLLILLLLVYKRAPGSRRHRTDSAIAAGLTFILMFPVILAFVISWYFLILR